MSRATALPIVMTDRDEVRFIRPDGQEDVGVTIRGMLKMMAGMDLRDVGSERRLLQLQRYQERVHALWAMESIRVAPRDFGDLLFQEFDGQALEDGIDEACDGNGAAFGLTFEAMLDRCVNACS